MTSDEEMARECRKIVTEEAVFVPHLPVTDRNSVLQAAVRHIAEHKGICSEQDIKSLCTYIIRRENQGSTGFGKGIAIPHLVGHPSITRGSVGWFTVPQGIDFAALDRAPVYIVVCHLSSPGNPDMHLATAEALFRIIQKESLRKHLLQAENSEEMKNIVAEALR
jgi:mannitol/fructose-specific phosphotransferase system IIA component (Ntr-type)